MTIDEAIAHAREVAKNKMAEYQNHYDKDAHYYPRQCKKCAEEQEQLAEWLEELKALKNGLNIKCDNLNEALEKGKKIGYKKAIDDFAEKLKRENKETIPIHSGYCRMSFDEIAEQLKAGVKE